MLASGIRARALDRTQEPALLAVAIALLLALPTVPLPATAVRTAHEQATAALTAAPRPATPTRAGRDYFRARTMQALPVAPRRAVTHPARTVKSTPKKTAKPVRKPAKPRAEVAPAITIAITGRGAEVARWALLQVGKRYVYGTAGPNSFDCSGLSMAGWLRVGVHLPHNANAQRGYGRAVTRAQLQPGDLIFYPGHVGIAVGGGMMVAAATPSEGVKLQRIYGTPAAYRRL